MNKINIKAIENEILNNNSLIRINAASSRLIQLEFKNNRSTKIYFGETVKSVLKSLSNALTSKTTTENGYKDEKKTELDKAILSGGEMYIYLNDKELYNILINAKNELGDFVYLDCESGLDSGVKSLLNYAISWAQTTIPVANKEKNWQI